LDNLWLLSRYLVANAIGKDLWHASLVSGARVKCSSHCMWVCSNRNLRLVSTVFFIHPASYTDTLLVGLRFRGPMRNYTASHDSAK